MERRGGGGEKQRDREKERKRERERERERQRERDRQTDRQTADKKLGKTTELTAVSIDEVLLHKSHF